MTTAQAVLAAIWTVLNSPAGITTAAGVILWLLNRVYAAQPTWSAYEGAIISAVRFAEKAIPDGSPNLGMARLDQALKYVLAAFEAATHRRASAAEAASIKEGIQIVHNSLDIQGALNQPAAPTTPEA